MDYNLILPPNFEKVPLPGLNPWLAALRSGVFPQGIHRLAQRVGDNYNYCCLGVLYTVENIPGSFQPEGYVIFNGSTAELQNGIRQYDILGAAGQLPEGCSVDIQPGLNYAYLTGLNDNGLTFLQIADILEACFTHID